MEEEELLHTFSWTVFFQIERKVCLPGTNDILPNILFGDLRMFLRPWIPKKARKFS